MTVTDLPTRVLVAGVLVFLSVLGVFTALTLTGHDTTPLIQLAVTLLGLGGVGAHHELRTRQQNQRIAKIDKQTNGVLTARIENGARKAIRSELRGIGYAVPLDSDLDD